MNFNEVLAAARGNMGPVCKACPVCNGKACGTGIPGPGSRGDIAVRNYESWQKVYLNMDTMVAGAPVDTSLEIFGQKVSMLILLRYCRSTAIPFTVSHLYIRRTMLMHRISFRTLL